ncbi:MAG: 4-hydroxy-tetrahydrodipicolinate synthase, partial [Chitinophagaceae bacterium]|nr:4-hydroxy-tetrahydrodipicolinate synthase [Chitinophagaceae bacterium]
MYAHKFRGTGVALITPFQANGNIDFNALEQLVNRVIAQGVNYLVALGTTAETPTLSSEEKMDILRCVIETNAGRVPLVAGLGGNNTQAIIDQFNHYPNHAIDAYLSVSPYYNKPSQHGIIAHYKALNQYTPKPIIMYNVPGRTGSNMLAETSLQIAKECEHIIGIKEAAGNMTQSMSLIQHRPDGFVVLSGDDDLAMAQIACGFDGVISVAANCFTTDFCNMIQLALNYNMKEAHALHY